MTPFDISWRNRLETSAGSASAPSIHYRASRRKWGGPTCLPRKKWRTCCAICRALKWPHSRMTSAPAIGCFWETEWFAPESEKACGQSIGELLQQDLHLYGRALSQWNQQFARKMEFLISSYADAYRVQLQRLEGANRNTIDAPQLEEDLARLMNWEAEETPRELQNLDRRA